MTFLMWVMGIKLMSSTTHRHSDYLAIALASHIYIFFKDALCKKSRKLTVAWLDFISLFISNPERADKEK